MIGMCIHLSTCGSTCPGEPTCSETADVVLGESDEVRRARYGALPNDAVCEHAGCGAQPGEPCRDPGGQDRRSLGPVGRWHHGERSIAALRMRHDAGRPVPGWTHLFAELN